MDYALLALLALVLGAGAAGGVLVAWSCHRRVLALELNLKVIFEAYEDRLNQISKIVIRQDKSEAAKTRWSKKEVEETTLAKTLSNVHAPDGSSVLGHPWDPRTWGKSG